MACMQVELDDDCLLTIMSFLSPLPDLISLSKACRVRSIYVTNVHVRKYVVVNEELYPDQALHSKQQLACTVLV